MEEKMERILKSVLKVQSSIASKGNNEEFNNAIVQIRRENGVRSDNFFFSNKMTKQIEKFVV